MTVQVLLPVLGNSNNHGTWPKVVSDDVLKHVYLLKNRVHVLSGQVRGKTLLPLPASAEFNRSLAAGDTTCVLYTDLLNILSRLITSN